MGRKHSTNADVAHNVKAAYTTKELYEYLKTILERSPDLASTHVLFEAGYQNLEPINQIVLSHIHGGLLLLRDSSNPPTSCLLCGKRTVSGHRFCALCTVTPEDLCPWIVEGSEEAEGLYCLGWKDPEMFLYCARKLLETLPGDEYLARIEDLGTPRHERWKFFQSFYTPVSRTARKFSRTTLLKLPVKLSKESTLLLRSRFEGKEMRDGEG